MAHVDLGRLLLEAHRAVGAEFVALLDERGYPDARPGHAAVVLHLDRRSGTRLSDLANRARMTKQGMMLVVDELEERGYVRRVPDPADARAKIVRLTARGRRYVAEARRVIAAIESGARRDLGDRRYDVLAELEERVRIGALGEEDARAEAERSMRLRAARIDADAVVLADCRRVTDPDDWEARTTPILRCVGYAIRWSGP